MEIKKEKVIHYKLKAWLSHNIMYKFSINVLKVHFFELNVSLQLVYPSAKPTKNIFGGTLEQKCVSRIILTYYNNKIDMF